MDILSLYNQYVQIIKENPVAGGIISVWALGTITWLLKSIPSLLYRIISKFFIARVSISNAAGSSWQEVQYHSFLRYYSETKWFKHSKSVSINSGYSQGKNGNHFDNSTVCGPGVGLHIFFADYKLYWFNIVRHESSGTHTMKEEIILYTFGFTNKTLIKFSERFLIKFDQKNNYIYHWGSNSWELTAALNKRDLSTVVIDPNIKTSIMKEIEFVTNNAEWFTNRGLAPKSTILLYGKPGGGKTSIIRSLASHYSQNIFILSLSDMSDRSLQKALSLLPKNVFLLLEDFDGVNTVSSREQKKDSTSLVEDMASVGLTIGGILNAFDGIIPLNNVVTFLTTNHIEKIDAALLRKGRVDLCVEIKELSSELICKFILISFPETNIDDINKINFLPIMGCDLQELFFRNRDNLDEFIDSIPKYQCALPEHKALDCIEQLMV